mmetsp:Transcript_2497/g.5050  ORF Transcript_2497/g.5050 Transcript_2497/m.5050 type:complete len:226 (-) Transcript_2497:2238-2915(-)
MYSWRLGTGKMVAPLPAVDMILSSSSLQMTIIFAPLALNCSITLIIFVYTESGVAITRMGMCSSTKARGPCFISPARIPSLCMRETSLTLRAPSTAVAKFEPRPNMSKECSFARDEAKALILSSNARAFLTASDSDSSASITFFLSSNEETVSPLNDRANNIKTTIWEVYAFVLATPISAPALRWTPQWVRRAMADPTVLVIPTHSAPLFNANSNDRNVSAVSPL